MDIDNDRNILMENEKILSQRINRFGDVNMKMINMISLAKNLLEGNQMDLAEKATFETVHKIKNTIESIEEIIRYLDELDRILAEYSSYKFSEV